MPGKDYTGPDTKNGGAQAGRRRISIIGLRG